MSLGYRIVSFKPGRGHLTLAGGVPVTPVVGAVESVGGAGLYLGTTREFCIEYYTGLTDGEDVLLTYEYGAADLFGGDPGGVGEIRVKAARLVGMENLPCPDGVPGGPSRG